MSQNYIEVFAELGKILKNKLYKNELDEVITKAYHQNTWFTPEYIHFAIENICNQYLDSDKLFQWLKKYEEKPVKTTSKVGIVMAANIPLVGFHDLLCVLISGHHAIIKPSARDKVLIKNITELLINLEPAFNEKIETVERLSGFDAVIATGNNNSLRYFEYYFGKYPSVIRGNRNSLAILDGNESPEELKSIGTDIFTYYGLGCRSVSALLVPQDYSFDRFYEAIQSFESVIEHNKYKNNYDYNKSLLLLNRDKHLDNGFLILIPSEKIASPMASLNYMQYSNKEDIEKKLSVFKSSLQCIISKKSVKGFNVVTPGKSQIPSLTDYADNIDTMDFLRKT